MARSGVRGSSLGRVGLALGVAALCGCQAGGQHTRGFPAVWPGTQPFSADAPTVSVLPVLLDLTQLESSPQQLDGLPTAAVLSVLLVKYLHVNGVHAMLKKPEAAPPQYTLECHVPQLGYGSQETYPKQRRYRAELACRLKEEATQTMVWERNFTQAYEEAVVIDLLTQLPQQPHREERVLYRECIVPLWDVMASSVGTVVTSRQQLSRAAAAPRPDLRQSRGGAP